MGEQVWILISRIEQSQNPISSEFCCYQPSMDEQPPYPQQRLPPEHIQRKERTSEQRQNIVTRLLWELKDGYWNGKFGRGVLTAIADEFHVSHFTIRRVWKRAFHNFEDPTIRSACMDGHVDQVDNGNDENFNGQAAREEENMQMIQKLVI